MEKIPLISATFALSLLAAVALSAAGTSLTQDGIPVVVNPEFIPASAATFLKEDELVLGVVLEGQAKAYPIRILGQYEVINDRLADTALSATW